MHIVEYDFPKEKQYLDHSPISSANIHTFKETEIEDEAHKEIIEAFQLDSKAIAARSIEKEKARRYLTGKWWNHG